MINFYFIIKIFFTAITFRPQHQIELAYHILVRADLSIWAAWWAFCLALSVR